MHHSSTEKSEVVNRKATPQRVTAPAAMASSLKSSLPLCSAKCELGLSVPVPIRKKAPGFFARYAEKSSDPMEAAGKIEILSVPSSLLADNSTISTSSSVPITGPQPEMISVSACTRSEMAVPSAIRFMLSCIFLRVSGSRLFPAAGNAWSLLKQLQME